VSSSEGRQERTVQMLPLDAALDQAACVVHGASARGRSAHRECATVCPPCSRGM